MIVLLSLLISFSITWNDTAAQVKGHSEVRVMNFDQFAPYLHLNNDTVYLVNFWATSCVTCVKEMPDLMAVHKEFEAKGYTTIAVAMSYDRPDYIATFVKDRQLPFLVIHDRDNAWAKAYGDVSVTPTTFLVDAKGRIIKRYVGEPNFPELRKILAKELG